MCVCERLLNYFSLVQSGLTSCFVSQSRGPVGNHIPFPLQKLKVDGFQLDDGTMEWEHWGLIQGTWWPGWGFFHESCLMELPATEDLLRGHLLFLSQG
jgi:hypothetical protein